MCPIFVDQKWNLDIMCGQFVLSEIVPGGRISFQGYNSSRRQAKKNILIYKNTYINYIFF